MRKKRKKKKLARSKNISSKKSQRKRLLGDIGIMGRAYPHQRKRLSIIENLKAKPENERSPDEWWLLGEFQIFDGVMEENDFLVNEGVLALQSGADLPNPNPACLLDLGWILLFKNMDALALPYLRKATELEPDSRDSWAFRALAEIGCNDRNAAINSLEKAIRLPGATEYDMHILNQLNGDKSLKEIRKEAILRKIEPEVYIHDVKYEEEEKTKWYIHVLKEQLKTESKNVQLQMLLAEGRYRLNQFELSEKLLLRVTASQGDNTNQDDKAKAYSLLALIAKKHKKDRDLELNYYQKALEHDPENLLALINLASAYQEDGEWYLARDLLERACQGDNTSPHFPLALDLYGSNVGNIEKNFKKEIAFHESAIRLNPNNPIFYANLIVALLCDGQIDEAKVYFKQQKNKLTSLVNFKLITNLMVLYDKKWGTPFQYLDEKILDFIGTNLSLKAAHPLLRNAWRNRHTVVRELSQKKRVSFECSNDELLEVFYNDMGIYATNFKLNDDEISEIWSEAKLKTGNINFDQNHAVHMSSCGRHSEALELIDSLEPEIGGRFHTILGNIRMNANQYLAAIDAYKLALLKDEKFLLPISNAIDCVDKLKKPDLLKPFITELEKEWAENFQATRYRARAIALIGFPKKAAKLYTEILTGKNGPMDPDEFRNRYVQKDPTLLHGKSSMLYHKNWAAMLIDAGQLDEFESLYNQVLTWPKWLDGDWTVMLAEVARRRGKIKRATELINDMGKQPPPQITLALCALEEGNFSDAKQIALEVLEDSVGAEKFNHLEGRPDAIAKSILALELLNRGQLKEAKELAATSIKDDTGSAICRTTYANILLEMKDTKEAIRSLKEGIKRRPGNPALLRVLVETLVNNEELEVATEILHENRAAVSNHGAPGLAARLGELIALEKLALIETPIDLDDLNISWIKNLSEISKGWLQSLHEIDKRNINLVEAKMLYTSKIAEKELAECIFIPFRDTLENPEKHESEDYIDFSHFLAGDFSPSIGGMHRILLAAKKEKHVKDSLLLIKFRNFLNNHSDIKIQHFKSASFLRKLNGLAHARNAVAHVGEPNIKKWNKHQNFVLTKKSPGPLLQALGFTDKN